MASESLATTDVCYGAESYGPALRRFFRRKVSIFEVEDLVQEVFLNMQARRSSNVIRNLDGYIFTVAANVLNRYRSKSCKIAIVGDVDTCSAQSLINPITPERIILGKEDVEAVIAALEELPDRTRDIFIANRFNDKSYAVIAKSLDISVSAVEKHIISALRALSAAVDRRS